MATTIKLTMMARWGLDDLLGKQNDKDRRGRRVLRRIRQKLLIPPELRREIAARYETEGEMVFERYPETPLELEAEEISQLLDLGSLKLPVAFDIWLEPVMEQLEGGGV